jgi:hypothetical protein
MTTLPVLLAYAGLLFVALLALLWSSWPGWLKAMLVLGVTVLYFHANGVMHQVWGWPSGEALPERFLLHAAVVDEPTTKRPGGLYVWVSAIEDGRPAAQPRAYRLAYDKLLHAELNEGTRRIRSGISQMGITEPAPDKGEIVWLRQHDPDQKFKLRDMAAPQLPEK